MTKKKTLFKNISIFLCLALMLVLSLYCLVPKKEFKSVAAADVVVRDFTFVGSNIIVPVTSWNNGTTFDIDTFISTQLSIIHSNGSYSIRFVGSLMRKDLSSVRTFDYTYSGVQPYSNSSLSNVYTVKVPFYETYVFLCSIEIKGYLTENINRVVFNSSIDGDVNNDVRYYDNADNYIEVTFETRANTVFEAFKFDYRLYYINLDFIDNNTFYQAGYTDGYNQGVSDGSTGGYSDGYKAGETIGYQNGYNAGVEHGGNYSFIGLIGAVIDAPVSAFTNLLNFELLGVNILGFISGLLTLALIIFIIKLCMGGK